jgi:hypothetical protein
MASKSNLKIDTAGRHMVGPQQYGAGHVQEPDNDSEARSAAGDELISHARPLLRVFVNMNSTIITNPQHDFRFLHYVLTNTRAGRPHTQELIVTPMHKFLLRTSTQWIR